MVKEDTKSIVSFESKFGVNKVRRIAVVAAFQFVQQLNSQDW